MAASTNTPVPAGSTSDPGDDSLPVILLVTPEITSLPESMGGAATRIRAKAGGLADVSASLFSALHAQGFPVHLAIPNFAKMFGFASERESRDAIADLNSRLPEPRIHLAEDWRFYERPRVYTEFESHNNDLAIAFQREVIKEIIPKVRPDLIHCNDWMTGLVPPVARSRSIKSLLTIHNIHSCQHFRLQDLKVFGFEDHWLEEDHVYKVPKSDDQIDFLASGIHSADHVNAVSPNYLAEIVSGQHVPEFLEKTIIPPLRAKYNLGAASGILNAPDTTYDPATDPYLEPDDHFGAADHVEGKARCKARFQEAVGLPVNPDVPLFFWPSRLDPIQKGPQLLVAILPDITAAHPGLQVAFVADGPYQHNFENVVRAHRLHDQVVLAGFDEKLSHLGYAAADFMLMPSRYEPCGLPQMVSPKYGTLSVAHDTGGIHDTVDPLDVDADSGNGFLFEHFDSNGLRWAMNEAVRFHGLPAADRERQITRIMEEAAVRFDHRTTAQSYIDLYRRMLV